MKTKQIALALLALPLMLTASCSKKDSAAHEEGKTELPAVRIAPVEVRPVEQLRTYTASVEPELTNNISANMQNRIKEIYVDEGMRVSKGQRLVLLDDVNTSAYELQVDNARAALANAQLDCDRARQLYEIGGGTRQTLDQMELQVTNARNTLANAERTLRNARENTILTSPISGVVTVRNYDPGDMTGNLPILTVAQIQPVKAVVNVSESEYSQVHRGMATSVTFDTYGEEVFPGTVTMVSPTVDPTSRTFGAEITIPNPDSRILPGMFGRVTLSLGRADHAVVPDRAVIKQPGAGAHYVYVFNPADSTVSYRRVQLGQRLGDAYEITDGLQQGDQAVISDQSRLSNGLKVRVLSK